MPNPADITQQVLDRIMNLKEFTVKIPVNDKWNPNGMVPFDVKIKNGIATVKLPALTKEEAFKKVNAYFNPD